MSGLKRLTWEATIEGRGVRGLRPTPGMVSSDACAASLHRARRAWMGSGRAPVARWERCEGFVDQRVMRSNRTRRLLAGLNAA